MNLNRYVKPAKPLTIAVLIAGVVATACVFGYRFLAPARESSEQVSPPHADAKTAATKIIVGDQAQKNLGLTAKPLRTETFWKTITVPGMVVDRPGC